MQKDSPKDLPQRPPRFCTKPAEILDETRLLIEHAREIHSKLTREVDRGHATFENTIRPLAMAENRVLARYNTLKAHQYFSPDSEARKASIEATTMMEDYNISTTMNEYLFELISSVVAKEESLGEESQRLLTRKYREYVKNGMSLPDGPERERMRQIKVRLRQLESTFNENLSKCNRTITLTADDLVGVPATFLSGLDRSSENGDEYTLKLSNQGNFSVVARHAHNPETRRKYYTANENRCSENVPIFSEVIRLRQELSQLLGYRNYASLCLEDRLAGTPRVVVTFMKNLITRLMPIALQEVEKMKNFRSDTFDETFFADNDKYCMWDHPMCERVMIEQDYAINQLELAEYFSLSNVVENLLELVQETFRLRIAEISAIGAQTQDPSSQTEALTWHEDVRLFSVWDNDDTVKEFRGYLYLDFYFRNGKKSTPVMINLSPGFLKDDGTRHYPSTLLMCSFPKPTKGKPTLLRHDEVVVLFHELGHAIHDLVSTTTYACFHGPDATSEDFGEAPSQMLEYWCWTPSVLKRLGKHYSYISPEYLKTWEETYGVGTPRPAEILPDDTIAKLCRTKSVNRALSELRQLSIVAFDMMVHQAQDRFQIETWDLPFEWSCIRTKVLPLIGPESLSFNAGDKTSLSKAFANFSHLVGSYGAGYYSYQFSKVYAADIFYNGLGGDPLNVEKVRAYRRCILEKGGARDPMKLLHDFLGRAPSTAAFERELMRR
ncbi:metallopeptidase MepB [Xylariaceae sp. FL1272]|nr:metallopeptidase MepB [Xylariaceae sp. FL1272]